MSEVFLVVLSKIDIKILDFVCLKGAQMSEKEIAKRLRLKPTTVSYSLKKMLREKSILGYRYRVNYARLGLVTTAWVLLKIRSANTDSFHLFDQMLEFPQVHVASFITGEFDIALKVLERDVSCVDAFVRKLSKTFPEFIDSAEVLLVTENYKTHNILPKNNSCLTSFDKTDFKILSSRMNSPEKELGQIASELNLHRNTVSKRWKSFWKENVLIKKTPVINPLYYTELKLSMKAIVLIDVPPEACDILAKKLLELDEVHELNRLLDGFSLMAIIRTGDISSFLDFLRWVLFENLGKGKIRKTVSLIMLKSKPHKQNYFPQLLDQKIIRFRKEKLVCNCPQN